MLWREIKKNMIGKGLKKEKYREQIEKKRDITKILHKYNKITLQNLQNWVQLLQTMVVVPDVWNRYIG